MIRVKINAYWGSATSLDLSDGVNFSILSWDGLGMAPVKNILTSGPLQQGSTRIDSKLQPRIISLGIDAIAGDEEDFFTRRQALLQAFLALSSYPLKFIVEWDITGGSTSRLIDVFYNGQFTMASKDMSGFHQKTVVELLAPYPVWRSDDLQTPTVSGGAGSVAHTYVGSWEVQPWEVKITGPVTDPLVEVYHADGTHEKLDFTGITIGAGHYYKIDCRYDYRTIVDDTGADKSGDLTDDSDLGTFCIKKSINSDTHLVSGANSIWLNGTSTSGATELKVSFYPNFIGI